MEKEYVPRKQVLTERDLEALAELFREYTHCTLGLNKEVADALNKLTVEELGMFKRGVSIMGRAANIIGTVVLTAIVTAIIAVFTKGFWAELASGINKVGK